jgi:hypothetical protein
MLNLSIPFDPKLPTVSLQPVVDEFSSVLALWALEVGDESETHYFGLCYHSVGHAYRVYLKSSVGIARLYQNVIFIIA